jgi:hypothetical protein
VRGRTFYHDKYRILLCEHMTTKLFLVGIVAGLFGALSLAALFSTISEQSAAQMMGADHMGNLQASAQDVPWHTNHASFSASGTSYVENVQVSGISISGEKQVTVNIRFTGNGTTPSVVVIAKSDPMMEGASAQMMAGGAMHSGMMMGVMPTGQGMTYGDDYRALNSTQMNELHQMHNMMSGSQIFMWNGTSAAIFSHQQLVGSSVLESGWSSGDTLRVILVGDGSAYEMNSVSVMVYPLTS